MSDAETLELLSFLFIFMIILFSISLAFYILQGIGLFKLAKKQGSDKGWMAWVPAANAFLPMILVEDDVHDSFRGRMVIIFAVTFAASFVLSLVGVPFVSLIPAALGLYAFYFIAVKYSQHPVVHLVVAILTFGCSVAIQYFIFGISKKQPYSSDDSGTPADGRVVYES